MLSKETRRAMIQKLHEFGERARRGRNHRDEARELFAQLKRDDGIKPLGKPGWRSAPLLDLAAQRFPEWEAVYAIDSGSTRLMHFENGTLLCANQAVISSDPASELRGLPLEAYRSVSMVSHTFRDDLGGASSERHSDNWVQFWRIHLTPDKVKRKVDQLVKGLADIASESAHTLRMLEELKPRQSFFILDGNVFPIGLLNYMAGEGGTSWGWKWDIHLDQWDPAVELMSLPLRVAETFAEHQLIYVALNKNPDTKWFIHYCLDERRQYWANDRQFFKAVLSDVPKDHLSYSSWFVQEAYPSPAGGSGESVDLFQRLHVFTLALEPKDYHVCFFYVYDPRIRTVMKVETPRLMLRSHDAARVQQKMLAELARGQGVPHVIRRADSRARITQEEREALLRECGLGLDLLYNQTRGEPL
jgi:hypothetical protein